MKLRAKVIEAKGLPNMDIIGKSDPYCLLQMSNCQQVYRTKTINNTSRPVWNEEFIFPVSKVSTDVLMIAVKDEDTVSADDQIGKCQISLSSLKANVEKDEWIDLQSTCDKPNVGSIHISVLLSKV